MKEDYNKQDTNGQPSTDQLLAATGFSRKLNTFASVTLTVPVNSTQHSL
jgi:hypothetical protein